MITIVTSYPNPDMDGTGCAIAYAEFLNRTGTEAAAYLDGTPHLEAAYVLSRFSLPYTPPVTTTENPVVLVDCSDLGSLPKPFKAERVTEVIDHHLTNYGVAGFHNAALQIEGVGAAATLVTERFQKANLSPSPVAALVLQAAIISNTLNFQSFLTTERDRQAAAWLATVNQLPEGFAHDMFAAKSNLAGNALRDCIVGDFVATTAGGHGLGIAQLEIVGGQDLIDTRKAEIIAVISSMATERKLDYCFLNLIELEAGHNFFITNHAPTQELLAQTFNVSFKDDVAILPRLTMRKELIPALKARFT